jgi:hypothetical protein
MSTSPTSPATLVAYVARRLMPPGVRVVNTKLNADDDVVDFTVSTGEGIATRFHRFWIPTSVIDRCDRKATVRAIDKCLEQALWGL